MNVRMWPTPVVSDKHGGQKAHVINSYTKEKREMRLSHLRNAVLYYRENNSGLFDRNIIDKSEYDGQLNPAWTEALMLWPVGWTSLSPMSIEYFREYLNNAHEGTLWNVDPADLSKDNEHYIPRVKKAATHRRERIIALGNGQVPPCVCLAETILYTLLNNRSGK